MAHKGIGKHEDSIPAIDAVAQEGEKIILTKPVDTIEGTIPAGSCGTVVVVHSGADAYEVEFARPFQSLVTVAVTSCKRVH